MSNSNNVFVAKSATACYNMGPVNARVFVDVVNSVIIPAFQQFGISLYGSDIAKYNGITSSRFKSLAVSACKVRNKDSEPYVLDEEVDKTNQELFEYCGTHYVSASIAPEMLAEALPYITYNSASATFSYDMEAHFLSFDIYTKDATELRNFEALKAVKEALNALSWDFRSYGIESFLELNLKTGKYDLKEGFREHEWKAFNDNNQ